MEKKNIDKLINRDNIGLNSIIILLLFFTSFMIHLYKYTVIGTIILILFFIISILYLIYVCKIELKGRKEKEEKLDWREEYKSKMKNGKEILFFLYSLIAIAGMLLTESGIGFGGILIIMALSFGIISLFLFIILENDYIETLDLLFIMISILLILFIMFHLVSYCFRFNVNITNIVKMKKILVGHVIFNLFFDFWIIKSAEEKKRKLIKLMQFYTLTNIILLYLEYIVFYNYTNMFYFDNSKYLVSSITNNIEYNNLNVLNIIVFIFIYIACYLISKLKNKVIKK